jgi:hypothetical protein
LDDTSYPSFLTLARWSAHWAADSRRVASDWGAAPDDAMEALAAAAIRRDWQAVVAAARLLSARRGSGDWERPTNRAAVEVARAAEALCREASETSIAGPSQQLARLLVACRECRIVQRAARRAAG